MNSEKVKEQLNIIKKASERAQLKIDYELAHDDEVLKAIDVIENFLKKKHRICYGGQAINAYLPSKYKIYNAEYAMPDYDFFTSSQTEDINTIIKDLQREGFKEIGIREGMHEGTVKIYVNYTSIADITVINKNIYNILLKNATRIDGITYLNANALRMLMYLELSRPWGEVTRWNKVYERLLLFNEFVPIRKCKEISRLSVNHLTQEQVEYVINYIIENKCIFAGAELVSFYESVYYKRKKNIEWIISTRKAILFYSHNAEHDALSIMNYLETLHDKKYYIKSYDSVGIIPSMKIICNKSNKVNNLVFIIDSSACHAFFNINVNDNMMKIASIDTLISLYFSLGLIDSHFMDIGAMECLANQLVELSIETRRNHKAFKFPFISIKCKGHQPSLPSLIRDKVKRIKNKNRLVKYTIKNK